MDTQTAQKLTQLNTRFYAENSGSFAASRHNAWPGWQRCLELIAGSLTDAGAGLRVLDLACGNLRFEEFLAAALPGVRWEFHAVDNCAALVPAPGFPGTLCFQELDIAAALAAPGVRLHGQLEAPECDLAVSFGFLHHLPLLQQRLAVLECLLDALRPDGFAIVTLWQFMQDARLAARYAAMQPQALERLDLGPLDEGDYILDWDGRVDALRYCHSFSDAEAGQLAAAVAGKARLLASFKADGRTRAMNTYLLFQKMA